MTHALVIAVFVVLFTADGIGAGEASGRSMYASRNTTRPLMVSRYVAQPYQSSVIVMHPSSLPRAGAW